MAIAYREPALQLAADFMIPSKKDKPWPPNAPPPPHVKTQFQEKQVMKAAHEAAAKTASKFSRLAIPMSGMSSRGSSVIWEHSEDGLWLATDVKKR